MNENFLFKKLNERKEANAFRQLKIISGKVDFCSNDYLGIVKNNLLENAVNNKLAQGSTGSRLLSGNYPLIEETEKLIADFHDTEAALIFNSGYDANVGLLSCVPQKDDIILYDQLSHASIRDGIRLSFAKAHSFLHNDIEDLEESLKRNSSISNNIFVVTESIFSMDGDKAPLEKISSLCEQYNAHLIVDEAHATGVEGPRGEGLVQELNLQNRCFARVHTFGKACGAHGAVVVGSHLLKDYLINFSRPFIFSTSLPPAAVIAIKSSYEVFPALTKERSKLQDLIHLFSSQQIKYETIKSDSPIQAIIVPGNEEVKKIAATLQTQNFDIRPILYPTVPKGKERLRIVLHAFNTKNEVATLLNVLS
jgi:8-amino-7-oxononanoate synthase